MNNTGSSEDKGGTSLKTAVAQEDTDVRVIFTQGEKRQGVIDAIAIGEVRIHPPNWEEVKPQKASLQFFAYDPPQGPETPEGPTVSEIGTLIVEGEEHQGKRKMRFHKAGEQAERIINVPASLDAQAFIKLSLAVGDAVVKDKDQTGRVLVAQFLTAFETFARSVNVSDFISHRTQEGERLP